MSSGPTFLASVLLLFANIVLGGGTRTGYLADVLLQFLAIPPLLLAIWLWIDRLRPVGGRLPLTPELVIGAAMAAVGLCIALAQAIPLFGAPGWQAISERIVAAGGAPLDGVAWTGSSSVDPAASLAALPALLPALAMFLLVGLLDAEQRLRFVGWMIVLGLIPLAIGIVQVAQGSDSLLRFFEFNHKTEAVGFFANRNHLAAQLYVTLVVGAAWFVTRGEGILAQRTPVQQKMVWLAWGAGFVLLFLAGIALARSRAGILLAVFAAGAFVAMAPTLMAILRGSGGRSRAMRGLAFAMAAATLLLVGQLGSDRFLHRFDDGVLDQIRLRLNVRTIDLVAGALPFGTGLGTFPEVYAVQDNPEDLRADYVNRAHDDWLELPLEAGIAGIALIALFLGWLGLRAFRLWVRPAPGETPVLLILPRCASIAVVLLLIHSVVDYPLRTATMLAYFAVCCALMVPPRGRGAHDPIARTARPSTAAADDAGKRPPRAAARSV